MKPIETLIAEITSKKGYKFSVATPSRENFKASAYDREKVLWYDIQQNGQFALTTQGMSLDTHVKLHFMDDHIWDAEDHTANHRKNIILKDAFECIAEFNQRAVDECNVTITQNPQWQVVYCKFDQNKIDVAVDFYVRETTINFC